MSLILNLGYNNGSVTLTSGIKMSTTPSSRRVCAICQDEILPDANISKLNCNHEYHRDCLQSWLDNNHNTCPLDRGRITSINGISTEHVEENGHYRIETQNPLIEARALYLQSIRVVHNPSIHSVDSVERQAARVQAISFFVVRPTP